MTEHCPNCGATTIEACDYEWYEDFPEIGDGYELAESEFCSACGATWPMLRPETWNGELRDGYPHPKIQGIRLTTTKEHR